MTRRKYDQLFKTLLEADPRGFLNLCGVLPLDAPAEVLPLQREVTRDPVLIDHGFLIRDERGERIEHFEGFAHFQPSDAHRIAAYAAELAVAYRLPVSSTAVLLLPQYDRPDLPTVGLFEYGAFRAEYPFHLLRIWQTGAHDVLDLNRPSLLAWLPLLATTEDQFVEATHRLQRSADAEAATIFRILGELRYGKDVWQQVLQQGFRMIPDELLEQSTFLGEWKQRGILIGQQKGTHQEAVRIATGMLTRRFPSLTNRADALRSITDLKKLEDLIYNLSAAADEEAALRLLEDAAR